MQFKVKKSVIAISFLSLGLLVSIGFLTRAYVHNWFLKQEANRMASELGFVNARDNYVRGRYILLELKPFIWPKDGTVPNDGGVAPTGRQEGRFQIYSLLVDAEYPAPHLEIKQTYINGYNQHMRGFFEHPEWFDANGFRIPKKLPVISTNAPSREETL